jgi:hypothetical protein
VRYFGLTGVRHRATGKTNRQASYWLGGSGTTGRMPNGPTGTPCARPACSLRRFRTTNIDPTVNDGREALGPVVTVASEAADALAIPAHHQPVAVMLDFVDPQRAGRWPRRLRRLARFDEAGGTPPLRDHGRRITQWPGGTTMVASGVFGRNRGANA